MKCTEECQFRISIIGIYEPNESLGMGGEYSGRLSTAVGVRGRSIIVCGTTGQY